MQATDMMDKLTRILRIKPGQYTIHYTKGELKPQTRMSMVKELARIIFEGERARYPELGTSQPSILALEELIFTANILCPHDMIKSEMAKIDARKDLITELSTIFWVPKILIGFQLQMMLKQRTHLQPAALTQNNQEITGKSI